MWIRYYNILKLLAVLLACPVWSQSAFAEQRIALVIGNSSYNDSIGRLSNPVNDAALMTRTLERVGFSVVSVTDADQRTMRRAIRDFGARLEDAGRDGVGLFYFAGHGVQTKGVNYLIPVGAEIRSEADMEIEAVSAGGVLAQMEHAGSGVSIIVLDACRNNPFARGFRSATNGLARMDAPTGSLVAYSTAPGQVASDGTGRNSPYTRALSIAMQKPGLKLEEVFKTVRISVMERTEEQQVPWESSSLIGDFYFSGTQSNGTVAPPTQTSAEDSQSLAADNLFWNSIQSSDQADLFRAYLEAFPDGRFRVLAEAKLAELEGDQVAVGTFPVQPDPPQTDRFNSFRDCDSCPRMVQLPRGSFQRGSTQVERDWLIELGEDPDWLVEETPRTTVDIGYDLAVGQFEVTRGEFAAFVSDAGRRFGGNCDIFEFSDGTNSIRADRSWSDPNHEQSDRHPVACVDWGMATEYVNWLSKKTGYRYRLLTEAEWEYAARGGSDAIRFYGDDLQNTKTCDYANTADSGSGWTGGFTCNDKHRYTSPVGSYQPNDFGLYDMLGNVFEWTGDCFVSGYSKAPTNGRALKVSNCKSRVIRGGAWSHPPIFVRSAYRDLDKPTFRADYLGFRVAREIR